MATNVTPPSSSKLAVPKIRSRKGGAAIEMDDVDRKLLNLMQGSFPLQPKPYAAVATLAAITEDEVLRRVQHLLDERIIRQVTPIYDTRALGYGSMLVAAKVDPEHPWRAAKIINSHPGVSHNYLRNHEFNMWFTLAVEGDSKLGLQGTLDLMQELTGATSIRQLPTLKLFKIRMELEMDGDTKSLSTEGEAQKPVDLEGVAYDERDREVIRATQGDLPVVSEPYVDAAAALGMTVAELLEHLARMKERGILRRVAAILYHRRAGFSANGMGVWKVPDETASRSSARGWPPSAASRTATSARPTRTGPTPSSRWPTAAPRRSATRSSTRSPASSRSPSARRCTPRPSSRRSASCTSRTTSRTGNGSTARPDGLAPAPMTASLTDTRSAEHYARALLYLPGGVNSPVRAMRSIGRDPIFVDRAEGAELIDVDHNRYVDWVCSWGPLIHGHAHPEIVAAVVEAAAKGTTFGAPTAGEVDLAEEVCRRVPSVQMLRMTSSGTEASMSAIRLARAATGRTKLLKFAGAYHGHVDGLLAEAGSGLATQGIPASPGVPAEVAASTIVVPWNDPGALAGGARGARVRRADRRALPGQHGPRRARRGLPRAAARERRRQTARC